jgi:uncharacterized SAM-binding protein YcdF (DUF218 family)
MILVLGGGLDREKFTAQFAQTHPDLDIWLSSGSSQAPDIFRQAKISEHRIIYDIRATDTVTNFTTVVDNFKQRNIQHVYVITSDFHMPRSMAIATIVFGSHGITCTPIAVPSFYPPESALHILRDMGRSILWLVTGRTGASLRSRP